MPVKPAFFFAPLNRYLRTKSGVSRDERAVL
jgi:hypothetical protein